MRPLAKLMFFGQMNQVTGNNYNQNRSIIQHPCDGFIFILLSFFCVMDVIPEHLGFVSDGFIQPCEHETL